jgi:hypothetical protein
MTLKIKYYAYKIIGEKGNLTIYSNERQACLLILSQDSILVKTASDLSMPKYNCENISGGIENEVIKYLSNQLKKDIKGNELIHLGKSSVRNNIIRSSVDLYFLNLKNIDLDIKVNFEKVKINDYCKKIINGEILESESVHSYFLAKNKGLI